MALELGLKKGGRGGSGRGRGGDHLWNVENKWKKEMRGIKKL